MSENLLSPKLSISRSEREALLQQTGKIIWFTGLSGSGKSAASISALQKMQAP